ncbi:unnamed protein product (macronuclear) [Paramecium tetraurelia]|uniref:Uncharacterized protein n=1 Tax=Paramecium tetraurelia TaxID=5888 RepID=A0E021_PARTE|nr:uncharacterized protein GSPATT00021806001 [Paramecium tetraurelia]CAK88638.1 unnamed protein product [Paramecium tetraurelia]|eukprot:XP_001456035.1 hypothetical protein (macronuclear) [Paramecium tetraurelia strain d4-2]
MYIQHSSRLEGKHTKNSRSAQRVTPSHNLYTESSYISQILAHQQKINDIPNSNKRLLNNISPLSLNYKEGKILQKNYLQNKYSQLLEGNHVQRAGWKKYLLDGFKEKIENILNQNKKSSKLFKIKRQYFTRSVALQPTVIQDDYLTVDALIKKQNPAYNIEAVQDSLIQQHKQYLTNQKNTDYDEKLQNLVKQFEIIVDRIEKEAFKIKIPTNFQTAMQNYNDYYNVSLDFKSKHKSLKIIDFSKFEIKPRTKQSYALNFWDKEEIEEEYEQQVQTCRVSTQKECQEEILEEIRQYQSNQIFQQFIDLPKESEESENQLEQALTEQVEPTQSGIEKHKEKKVKKKNVRYKQKKRQSIEAVNNVNKSIKVDEIESIQNNNQSEILQIEQQSSQKIFDHKFVDYMLSLDDVHEADLSQFMEKQVAEYDSYIFCDPDEEVVYKHQVDWNCQIDFLLRNIG